jgi:hypothetical protein
LWSLLGISLVICLVENNSSGERLILKKWETFDSKEVGNVEPVEVLGKVLRRIS